MVREVVIDACTVRERRAAPELAAFERCDDVTVDVEHGVADDRRHARPERQHADEVERVRRGDAADLGGGTWIANAAQLVERLGERELLADKAGDEAAAADLA